MFLRRFFNRNLVLVALSTMTAGSAFAEGIVADFSGGFRGDSNQIKKIGGLGGQNTTNGGTGKLDPLNDKSNGVFQTFHARFKPRLIVNDQTLIYSEWHVGPSWGKPFGSDTKYRYQSASPDSNTGGTDWAGRFGQEAMTSQKADDNFTVARA